MVGDSVADLDLCKTTGVRSIGFAKISERGEGLAHAGAEALTDPMEDLPHAVDDGAR